MIQVASPAGFALLSLLHLSRSIPGFCAALRNGIFASLAASGGGEQEAASWAPWQSKNALEGQAGDEICRALLRRGFSLEKLCPLRDFIYLFFNEGADPLIRFPA